MGKYRKNLSGELAFRSFVPGPLSEVCLKHEAGLDALISEAAQAVRDLTASAEQLSEEQIRALLRKESEASCQLVWGVPPSLYGFLTADTDSGQEWKKDAVNLNEASVYALEALDAAQTAYQLARTEYGPSLDLFGRGDYARENSDGWEDSWTIGVTATYTLFDGFGRSSRVDAALAQAASAREALRIVEQNVLAETVAALLNVDYAREFNQTQSRNLELANEMVRIVEAGFRAGKNTQVEVLDARAALTQASGDFYRSAHAIASSLLQLRHATGTL